MNMNVIYKAFLLVFCLSIILYFIPLACSQSQEEDFVFKGEVVLGHIEKIELTEKKVCVKSKSGETVQLLVDPEETIVWIDDEEKEISDIKEGQEVEAKYRIDDKEEKIASWLDIITTDELILEESGEGTPETVAASKEEKAHLLKPAMVSEREAGEEKKEKLKEVSPTEKKDSSSKEAAEEVNSQ